MTTSPTPTPTPAPPSRGPLLPRQEWIASVAPGVLAAAFVWYLDGQARGIPEVLAGLAIFTGLLFSLQLSVFDNALKASRDPLLIGDGTRLTFLMRLREVIAYTVSVGLVGTVLLSGVAMFVKEPLPVWLTCVLVFVLLHFVTLIFSIVRRLTVAFHLLRG